jgi:hypothetical protein
VQTGEIQHALHHPQALTLLGYRDLLSKQDMHDIESAAGAVCAEARRTAECVRDFFHVQADCKALYMLLPPHSSVERIKTIVAHIPAAPQNQACFLLFESLLCQSINEGVAQALPGYQCFALSGAAGPPPVVIPPMLIVLNEEAAKAAEEEPESQDFANDPLTAGILMKADLDPSSLAEKSDDRSFFQELCSGVNPGEAEDALFRLYSPVIPELRSMG